MIENRKNKRVRIKDDFLWLLGPGTSELGQIIDISAEGLAFHYIDEEETADKAFELVIIFDKITNMGKVRFDTISDYLVEDSIDPAPVKMRRRGVKFVNLTREQKSTLANLMVKYAS